MFKHKFQFLAVLALILAISLLSFACPKAHASWEVTLYPASDGWIRTTGTWPGDWFKAAREKEIGDLLGRTDPFENAVGVIYASYWFRRSFFEFDLTAYAGFTVVSATFGVTGHVTGQNYTDIVMLAGSQSNPITYTDYDAFADGSVDLAVELDRILNANWNDNGLNTFTIPAAIIQADLGGAARLMMISGEDYDNTINGLNCGAWIYFSEQAGTDKDPTLTVTFADPVITDLFDDASIDPKWTVGAGVGGSVTQSNGCLNLNWAAGVSFPYAVQVDGLMSVEFDVRAEMNLDAVLPEGDGFYFYVTPDYAASGGAEAFTNSCTINYFESGGYYNIRRKDMVGGSGDYGTVARIGHQSILNLRIVRADDGTFDCYYSTECGEANWILLAEPGSPYTTSAAYIDLGFLAYQLAGGTGAVKCNWITRETELSGRPVCPSGNAMCSQIL